MGVSNTFFATDSHGLTRTFAEEINGVGLNDRTGVVCG